MPLPLYLWTFVCIFCAILLRLFIFTLHFLISQVRSPEDKKSNLLDNFVLIFPAAKEFTSTYSLLFQLLHKSAKILSMELQQHISLYSLQPWVCSV